MLNWTFSFYVSVQKLSFGLSSLGYFMFHFQVSICHFKSFDFLFSSFKFEFCLEFLKIFHSFVK